MEYPPVVEQSHQHTRTFTLGKLSTQFFEQRLNVGPAHIGRDWPSEDQFQGTLMLSFHG